MSSELPLSYYSEWLAHLLRPAQRVALARNPTARLGYGSCTGWFTSRKCGVRWPFESLLERDAFVVLEADPCVANYAAQPETFHFPGPGTRYTPDLLVRYADGSLLYREVKPVERVTSTPALIQGLSRIHAECARRSASFDIWTDEDIRREPRLCNSHRVTKATAFVTADALRFVAALTPGEELSIGEAIARFPAPPRLAQSAILGLAGFRLLRLDLERPLNDDTIIVRPRRT